MNARKRIGIPVVMAAVALALVAAGVALRLAREHVLAVQSEDMLDQTRVVASQMNAWLEDRKNDARFWSRIPACRASVVSDDVSEARETAGRVFGELVHGYPFLQSVNLLSTEGEVIASNMPDKIGKNFGDRDYFQHAMLGETYVSQVIISRHTFLPIFVVSSPVFGVAAGTDEPVLAVLYACVDLDRFEKLFVRPHCTARQELFIVDAEDRFVSFRDSSYVWEGRTLTDSAYVGLTERLGDNMQTFVADGRTKLAARAVVPITGWTVWATTDEEALLMGMGRIWRVSLMIGALVLIGSLLIVTFVWHATTAATSKGGDEARIICVDHRKAAGDSIFPAPRWREAGGPTSEVQTSVRPPDHPEFVEFPAGGAPIPKSAEETR